MARAPSKLMQPASARRKPSLADSQKKEKGRSRNACDRCKQKKVKVSFWSRLHTHANVIASAMVKASEYVQYAKLETINVHMHSAHTKTSASIAKGMIICSPMPLTKATDAPAVT